MNAKMKLVQSTQVTRLGSDQPDIQSASLLPHNTATLGILGRGKLEGLERREALRLEQFKLSACTDAEIHKAKLVVQAHVILAGERIAYKTAIARQELTTACVRITAETISDLENERVDRTTASFVKLTERELKLTANVKDGLISAAYHDFLRDDALASTLWAAERDTKATRAIADRIGDIHEFAALAFAAREDKQ